MGKLLTAPTYFKLAETKKGTVLVNRGRLQKEDISQRYNTRQFYFFDEEDKKLKCLRGGSLNYLMDLHEIDKSHELKITYAGQEEVQQGKFAGKMAHQFEIEILNDEELEANPEPVAVEKSENSDTNLDDLA